MKKSIRKNLFIWLSIGLIIALSACSTPAATPTTAPEPTKAEVQPTDVPPTEVPPTAEPVEEPTAEPEVPQTRIVKDILGIEVEIPGEVNKVVNLWPASNSAMLAMGAGEKLVGTTAFTKGLFWSPFVYPDIVNVPTATDNPEELLKLNPDVVITPNNEVAEKLNKAGIPTLNLMFSNFENMKEAFAILGDVLGPEYAEKAARWSKLVDDNFAEVDAAMAGLTDEEKPIVYYIQGQSNQGLYTTFRGDSIMRDWCEHGGGKWASLLLKLDGSNANPEEVLKLNPDVVIIGGPAQHELYEELMAAPEWKEINAVKNGRVYTNPMGLFPWERFGMESALQIKFAASVINPDLYQVDMVAETQAFYRDFVGVELTVEQAENMIAGLGPNGEITSTK